MACLRSTRPRVPFFALVSSLGLLAPTLAACGDDGDDETTTAGGTQSATSGASDGTQSDGSSAGTQGTTGASDGTDGDTNASTTSASTTDASTTGDDTAGSTGDGTGGSTGDSLVPVPCPAGDLTAPDNVQGSTEVQASEFTATCGGGGAPDIAYLFTAPAAGTYAFHTYGSTLDTLLYVLDGTCNGDTLACDDDGLTGGASLVTVDLAENQTVTVVVDGFGSVGAEFSLGVEVQGPSCPVGNLLMADNVAGGTVIATDDTTGSCAGGAGPDRAYTFTAPSTGTYTFDTIGSDFDTAIYVLDGTCGGSELGCNAMASGNYLEAGLAVDLGADQTITVVVDGEYGAFGNYELHVGQLTGGCTPQNLSGALPVTANGSTASADNGVAGGCGGLFGADTTYTWTAPATGMYAISTEGSDFDTVVHVRDGSCGGTEIACNDNATSTVSTSRSFVSLTSGQTVVIAVDGNGSGNFELEIDTAPAGGDCCITGSGPGCSVSSIETCVCALDSYCCSVAWDATCVSEAQNDCSAAC